MTDDSADAHNACMIKEVVGPTRVRCSKCNLKQLLKTNLTSLLLMAGVFSGVIVGVTLKIAGKKLSQKEITYFKFPGVLFLQMMKMVMIPVVVSSLLTATADFDIRSSGKISLRALVYYLVTFVIASLLGVLLCVVIKPGQTVSSDAKTNGMPNPTGSPLYAFMDLFRYAPVGTGFLIAATFASLPNLNESLQSLLVFTLVVIVGLFIHGFLLLPLLYLVIVRKNPYTFIKNVIPALLLGFGSESSGVTLPVTIRCLEEKNQVDPRVTRLLSSVGATINMDGICLYFTMMTIFIAQLEGITLNVGQLVTASLLAMSTAVGIGCVPGGHVVYMTMVPAALQLPVHNISLLFAVDWLLTRCRTVVNILGDCFGAGIVDSLSSRELHVTSELSSLAIGEIQDEFDTDHAVRNIDVEEKNSSTGDR
ncbi:excitatory amino acid transporter 3-like [Liolophura sinensis]|uniref:excitatory amino acid transporter 3-like n=1 Tax=Liolophura sinensis TaxID=3198878 RepID=UPI003158B384